MADLMLQRPQAGQRVELQELADARIVLGFAADQAVLERVGDNLVFTFQDGGTIVLNDFYTSFTRETLPEFQIDGQQISGEQFFAALGEDLMPAAGPGRTTENGGRFNDFSNLDLEGGIDRLNGLEIGFNGAGNPDDNNEALGGVTPLAGLDLPGAGADVPGGGTGPDTPGGGGTDPENPGGGGGISATGSTKSSDYKVDEASKGIDVPAGYQPDMNNLPQCDFGRFEWVDGKLIFTQTGTYDHKPGTDSAEEKFKIPLLDANGNPAGSMEVTVEIEDSIVNIGDSDEGRDVGVTEVSGALEEFDLGTENTQLKADVDGTSYDGELQADGSWNFDLGDKGSLTIDQDGNYTYKPSGNGLSENIDIKITGTDNDQDTDFGTINIDASNLVKPDLPTGKTPEEIRDGADNVIEGSANADNLIMGDVSGSGKGEEIAPVEHNIFIAIDVSQSMNDQSTDRADPNSGSRFDTMAESLLNMAKGLLAENADLPDGDVLTVKIYAFSGIGAHGVLEISLQDIANMSAEDLSSYLATFTGHGTDFNAPLDAAKDFFGTKDSGADNKFILITDATGSEVQGSRGDLAGDLEDLRDMGVDVSGVAVVDAFQIEHKDILLALQGSSNSLGTWFGQIGDYNLAIALGRPIPSWMETNYDTAMQQLTKLLTEKEFTQAQIDDFFADFNQDGLSYKIIAAPVPPYNPGRGESLGSSLVEDMDSMKGMDNLFGDDFDFVSSGKDYDDALDPGEIIEKPIPFVPGSDVLVGGNESDVLFGDMSLAGLKAIFTSMGMDGEMSTTEMLAYIRQHPGEFDVNDPIFADLVAKGDIPKLGESDALVGGASNDILFGGAGDDLLIGDGDKSVLETIGKEIGADLGGTGDKTIAESLVDSIHKMDDAELKDFADFVGGLENKDTDGSDILFGGSGDDILIGMGGDDALYGGEGSDILIGGSGNNFLDGGEGSDKLYGGSGNDIMVYDKADAVIDGGAGVDFLIGVDKDSLDTIFGDSSAVSNIEVLVFGDKSLSLTNLDAMKDIGITIKGDSVELDGSWNASAPVDFNVPDGYHAYTNDDNLTILVKQIENSNG